MGLDLALIDGLHVVSETWRLNDVLRLIMLCYAVIEAKFINERRVLLALVKESLLAQIMEFFERDLSIDIVRVVLDGGVRVLGPIVVIVLIVAEANRIPANIGLLSLNFLNIALLGGKELTINQ